MLLWYHWTKHRKCRFWGVQPNWKFWVTRAWKNLSKFIFEMHIAQNSPIWLRGLVALSGGVISLMDHSELRSCCKTHKQVVPLRVLLYSWEWRWKGLSQPVWAKVTRIDACHIWMHITNKRQQERGPVPHPNGPFIFWPPFEWVVFLLQRSWCDDNMVRMHARLDTKCAMPFAFARRGCQYVWHDWMALEGITLKLYTCTQGLRYCGNRWAWTCSAWSRLE